VVIVKRTGLLMIGGLAGGLVRGAVTVRAPIAYYPPVASAVYVTPSAAGPTK